MSFFDLDDDEIAPRPVGRKKWVTHNPLPKEKPPVIPTATEFPEVAQEITEATRANHDDNQDAAVQALHTTQAHKPTYEGLYALEGILRALRPIMVPIEANEPRMLGDSQNNTTARVYACEDALALLMPILMDTEHQITKQGVLDFLEGTK